MNCAAARFMCCGKPFHSRERRKPHEITHFRSLDRCRAVTRNHLRVRCFAELELKSWTDESTGRARGVRTLGSAAVWAESRVRGLQSLMSATTTSTTRRAAKWRNHGAKLSKAAQTRASEKSEIHSRKDCPLDTRTRCARTLRTDGAVYGNLRFCQGMEACARGVR